MMYNLRSSVLKIFIIAMMVLSVFGEDCRKIAGCYVCGKATNKTPWQMLYTTNHGISVCPPLTDKSCGNCDIYNWNGGKGGVDKFWSGASGKVVKCTQQKLSSSKSIGGNTCKTSGRIDVDAFTFADRDFVVFKDGLGTIGSGKPAQRTVKKGRWVKFESIMTVYCESKNGAPYCHFNSDVIV